MRRQRVPLRRALTSTTGLSPNSSRRDSLNGCGGDCSEFCEAEALENQTANRGREWFERAARQVREEEAEFESRYRRICDIDTDARHFRQHSLCSDRA